MRQAGRRVWCGVAGVTLVVAAGVTIESRQSPTLPEIMKLKLEHSQQILEGIALARYEQIERNANDLRILSDLSTWNVLRTPEYLQHSSDFRDKALRLTQAGMDQNLDAAALAYVELTLECVECHKYVRGVELARDHHSLPWPSDLAE